MEAIVDIPKNGDNAPECTRNDKLEDSMKSVESMPELINPADNMEQTVIPEVVDMPELIPEKIIKNEGEENIVIEEVLTASEAESVEQIVLDGNDVQHVHSVEESIIVSNVEYDQEIIQTQEEMILGDSFEEKLNSGVHDGTINIAQILSEEITKENPKEIQKVPEGQPQIEHHQIKGEKEQIVVQHQIEEQPEHVIQVLEEVENSIENQSIIEEQNVIEEQNIIEEQTVIEEQPVIDQNQSMEEVKVSNSSLEGSSQEVTEETVVVMTSDDTGTEEIVLRSVPGHETLTVQEVTDESGQIYLVETVDNVIVMESEDNAEEVDYVEVPQPKNMPSHVLGRNIINPSIDPFRNGKAPPKPRLGVKIPYRNLTSQMVTKQELANEILERSRRNNKDSPSGQNLFAKKLTQTLAKKLAPNTRKSSSESSKSGSSASQKSNNKNKVLNNSDLIAILEGDDHESQPEPDVKEPLPPPAPAPTEEMTKELERQIALKQLSELPDDPPPDRSENKKSSTKGNKSEDKNDMATTALKQTEETPDLRKSKRIKPENKKHHSEECLEDDLPKNPRFSSNVPLKTYTRKRKPSDEILILPDNKSPVISQVKVVQDSTKKIDLPVNSSNYMTKSSRIIKKKIIWDPDEVTTPRKMTKTTESSNSKEKLISPTKEVKNDRKEGPKIEKKNEKHEENKKLNDKVDIKIESPKIKDSFKKADSLRKPQNSPRQERSEKKNIIKAKESKIKESELKSPNDKLAALKNKKRLTEVDKLLMDEGAVNMLYSFKNEEDQIKKKSNKSLMSKTNELLNDLQTNSDVDSPKALRKKESLQLGLMKSPKKSSPTPSAVSRQKSRDSNRSSIHSPPPSPVPGFSADASRIIRRHSSSSFSSMDEDEDKEKTRAKKAEIRANRRKAETSSDSPKKKIKKEKDINSIPKEKINEEMSKNFNKLIENNADVSKYNKYKTFVVKKFNQLVQIVLAPNKNDDVFINIEMMHEIVALLEDLETDSDCNVVLITSLGSSFSEGINFKVLITQKESTKKSNCRKLATNIRDFLLCLANFPKVLVAGVHGDVIGLGVTMLPLFDMIVASNSAKFCIPNASLGCMAEGGSLLLLPHLSQNILVSELLYSSRKLTSEEAQRLGLVTKILLPDKFEDELLIVVKKMSNQSAQFMEATKKQLRQRMIPDVTTALNSETEMLVQQWMSPECQKNFIEKYFN